MNFIGLRTPDHERVNQNEEKENEEVEGDEAA